MKLLIKFITENPTLFTGLLTSIIIIVSGLLSFAFAIGSQSGQTEERDRSNEDKIDNISNKLDNLRDDISDIFTRIEEMREDFQKKIQENSERLTEQETRCNERTQKLQKIYNKFNGSGLNE